MLVFACVTAVELYTPSADITLANYQGTALVCFYGVKIIFSHKYIFELP
jgi:hypothetical protein